MAKIILASTSKYRLAQLKQLGVAFEAKAPLFDESKAKKSFHGNPRELALFLARGKAQSLLADGLCVIGADQLVNFGSQILGKPGSREASLAQLEQMQGKIHELVTATVLLSAQKSLEILEITRMHMRPLAKKEIETYVDLDQPLDCAGSYKIEKAGVSLFDRIEGEDWTAIQGLPLLKLGKALRDFGFSVPTAK